MLNAATGAAFRLMVPIRNQNRIRNRIRIQTRSLKAADAPQTRRNVADVPRP